MGKESVRPPSVAGLFYDASPEQLRRDVEGHLALAAVPGAVPAKALIAPHAGYVYSGPIAGSAFRPVGGQRDRVRRVVLLGPAHRVAVPGLALPADGAFETPLGRVAVDQRAVEEIRDLPQVSISRAAHADEHSLEVELPFLQTQLEDFALVPLVVGGAGPEAVAQVVDRLWGGAETLIVISSDLSHYLDYDRARERDRATAGRILAFDSTLSPYDACGAGPINGLLTAARRRGASAELLDLRNSGDTAGDRDRVVGYAAVAVREAA